MYVCYRKVVHVVIPLALRPTVIQLPHEGHPGTSRMKASARGVVWWSGMDVELVYIPDLVQGRFTWYDVVIPASEA